MSCPNGTRGCTSTWKTFCQGTKSLGFCRFHFSTPFQAIITPLSVQYLTGGTTKLQLYSLHTICNNERIRWFEATPPETTTELISVSSNWRNSKALCKRLPMNLPKPYSILAQKSGIIFNIWSGWISSSSSYFLYKKNRENTMVLLYSAVNNFDLTKKKLWKLFYRIQRSACVLNPPKLNMQSLRLDIGCGHSIDKGSPVCPIISMACPPDTFLNSDLSKCNFSLLAALSKISPGAVSVDCPKSSKSSMS